MPPSQKPVNSKQVPVKQESAAAAPVPQKGGKKAAEPVVAAPEVKASPVKAAAPAKAVAAAPAKAAAPVKAAAAAAPAEAEPAPKVGGGKKAAVVPVKKAAVPAKKGGAAPAAKKAAAPKKAVAPKAKKVEGAVEAEEGDDDEKGVRSFKVQLPGNEDFAGRFTGLTPYQAANKALSKYFRENKTVKAEITFSIRESTRGSKRSTYTYNGKREKLNIPVKYSIKSADGVAREIVKEYKNKLTKVKKAEMKELAA
jgi:hypothetical protein